MTNTPPGLKTDELTKHEVKWLKGNRKGLANLAKQLFGQKKGETLTPEQLDTIYDTWFVEWSRGNQERGAMDTDGANAMCMLLGVGLGDALIERVPGLEWKVITDPYGTDVGLHGQKVGTAVTHPTHMVAKRVQSGETSWVAKAAQALVPDLRSMLEHGKPASEMA